MVSKMCAVMCAFPGCSGVDPVARNMVLGLRYFSFRLLSPSTCRHHAFHIPTATAIASPHTMVKLACAALQICWSDALCHDAALCSANPRHTVICTPRVYLSILVLRVT